jgi:hypothetical protein
MKSVGGCMTFKEFWTNENNPALEAGSSVLTMRQLAMWLVVIVAVVLISINFEQKSQKAKQILLYILAGVLIGFEITSRIVNFIVTPNLSFGAIIKILLPLEICSVAVWVVVAAIFAKRQFLYEIAATLGLFAMGAFLLFPAVGINRTFMTFTCIYSTVSHMIGFVCSVLMLKFGLCKFEFRNIWYVYLGFAIMFVWGALFDFLIFPGSNYMYLIEPPLGSKMAVPHHIIYALLIAVYVVVFHVASHIKQRNKNQEKK